MIDLEKYIHEINKNGFTIIPDVFYSNEIEYIIYKIENANTSKSTFRKTKDLFAIRQFLKEVPESRGDIFTKRFKNIINGLFQPGYFTVKSIYFDKPAQSNWFVSYHQDLTISVKERAEVPHFGPWTVKENQYSVQPPIQILEENFTVRIHLDDTTTTNGALRVIPGSHLKGICRPESIDWQLEKEAVCPVPKGGIMIMKPLLLHASSKTTDQKRRRVIHIEFSNQKLPKPLEWSELIESSLQLTSACQKLRRLQKTYTLVQRLRQALSVMRNCLTNFNQNIWI
jgi:hypothetical protein